MARIRSLKPSFWSDLAVANLSRDARLLVIGMISFADDDGRFLASPGALAGYVFPNDSRLTHKHVARWRDEIAEAGIIRLYCVDGVELGWFPNWKKHQRINRATPSLLPPPDLHTQRYGS